jgi:hypothetical protein
MFFLVGLPRKSMKAILDIDLEKVLTNLGILESLRQGQLTCGVCGELVTEQNLRCIYPQGTEVRVCCDRPGCVEKAFSNVKRK